MKIVKLDIDEENLLSGLEAVALVENPAIEEDFYMFAKQQQFADTFDDYPQSAVDAAKQGIKRNEELGNKCATQVGKVRAQQLANREPVSLDTIRRMRSFLIRQKDNYELARDRKDYNACGYISYLLWGGPSALPWAEKKLRQAGEEFVKDEFEDLEDACQPGYKAYGLKTKNGRKVPNCVPIQQFNKLIVEDLIRLEMEKVEDIKQAFVQEGEIDGTPVYSTIEEAEAKAVELGCEGYHEHTLEDGKVVYMPCFKHDVATENFELDVTGLPNYTNEVSGSLMDKFQFAQAELDEKQMLIGPLMKANKLIPRLDDNGDKYFVYFDADTIEKLSYKLMQDKLVDAVNIEHDNSTPVKDVILVETWIVKDPVNDKSVLYSYTPSIGDWFGIYKVNNKDIWDNYVKTGKVKGFSTEGYFVEKALNK